MLRPKRERSIPALAPLALLTVGLNAAAQSPRVNAPVAPEAIYIGAGGARPGISVIDLNGFGQGTGDPRRSRFPLNPNVGAPGVFPPLAPGTSSLDGGGEGALTLTRNEADSVLLIGAPRVGAIADLHLGQPLDLIYNNENINQNVNPANQINPITLQIQPGNSISIAPHPNPPRLIAPSPNPVRGIDGEEPTITSSSGPPGGIFTTVPPCLPSPSNALVPGDPWSNDPSQLGIFGALRPGVFYGPQPPPGAPPPPTPFCPFTSRQQIGHFLYALDVDNRRVVVLNSNRFTVLASIDLPDPTSMAMAPHLQWLAVSNSAPGTVSFIDVDPLSPRFHQVVETVATGAGASGLAWQPEGEDLLVCNTADGSVTIIDGVTLGVRKQLRRQIRGPSEVVVSARQFGFGLNSWVYYAHIVNGDGTIAMYESGPRAAGSDNIVGSIPGPALGIHNISAIHMDASSLQPGVWVGHQTGSGAAMLSRLEVIAAPGPRPDRLGARGWAITHRIGDGQGGVRFAGNAIADFAFDEIVNLGAMPDLTAPWKRSVRYAQHSGKGLVKHSAGIFAPAVNTVMLFVALADAGQVQVYDLNESRILATIPAPGVQAVAGYWRQ